MSSSLVVRQPHGSVEDPAVSVVIPCYKVTEFIPDALESLRRQTFRNFEIILVNDGCPDTENLERALAPYSEEIVYIMQQNEGPSSARNSAILASRAPLIALLDGDDFWGPNYLEAQVEYLEAHPDVDVVYPDAWLFGGVGAGGLFSELSPRHNEPSFINVAAGQCFIFVGVAARKAAMMRVGLFDSALRSAEDLDLWLRMMHAGSKFACHDIPLAHYRQRIGSANDNTVVMCEFSLAVHHKLLNSLDLSADEYNALTEAVDRTAVSLELAVGKKALYAGRFDEALNRFVCANRIFSKTRLRVAIALLHVCPQLLHAYVRARFPTENSYLH